MEYSITVTVWTNRNNVIHVYPKTQLTQLSNVVKCVQCTAVLTISSDYSTFKKNMVLCTSWGQEKTHDKCHLGIWMSSKYCQQEELHEHKPQPRLVWGVWNSLSKYEKKLLDPDSDLKQPWNFTKFSLYQVRFINKKKSLRSIYMFFIMMLTDMHSPIKVG